LEYAKNATRLVTCVTDVRLPKVDLVTPKEPVSRKELAELVDEYGLKTNLQRLESALGW